MENSVGRTVFIPVVLIVIVTLAALTGVGWGFYVIALLAGVIFVVLFLSHPWMGILLILLARSSLDLFSENSIRFSSSFPSVNASALISIILIISCIYQIISRRYSFNGIPLLWPYSMFLFVSLMGVILLADDKLYSLSIWLKGVSILALFIIAWHEMKSEAHMNQLLMVILFSAFIPTLLGLYQYFAGIGEQNVPGVSTVRIFSTFVTPTGFSMYLAALLTLSISMILNAKTKFLRFIGIGFTGLIGLNLVLTFGRVGWVGALVGLLALAVLRRSTKIVILILVGVFLALWLFPDVARRGSVDLVTSQESTLLFRFNLWRVMLPVFYQNPIFGVGLGGFETAAISIIGQSYPPHNDYVRLLVETGVTGLFFYLWIYGEILWRSWKARRKGKFSIIQDNGMLMIALTISFMAMGMVDHTVLQPVLQFYLWAFIAFTMSRVRFNVLRVDDPGENHMKG